MDKKDLESTRKKVYEHRFQWPLALALLLLMLESVMGDKKGRGIRWRFKQNEDRRDRVSEVKAPAGKNQSDRSDRSDRSDSGKKGHWQAR